MTTMTLRGIDDSVARTLKERARQEETSVNAITLKILKEALGLEKRKRTATYHDLDQLAGTWSPQEYDDFIAATAVFEKVDEDMWK